MNYQEFSVAMADWFWGKNRSLHRDRPVDQRIRAVQKQLRDLVEQLPLRPD